MENTYEVGKDAIERGNIEIEEELVPYERSDNRMIQRNEYDTRKRKATTKTKKRR